MSGGTGPFSYLKHRLAGFSICARIAIGNAAIIVIGATTWTILTRSFPLSELNLAASILLVIAGVGICIALSYLITWLALQPLSELRKFSTKVGEDPDLDHKRFAPQNPDPETEEVAATLQKLISRLEASNRQLKAITSQTIGAQEEERKRISRWLHDDTGQALAILILQLERLEKKVPDFEVEITSEVKTARQLAARTLGELRKIIHGLRPTILDDLGLIPAIRWYARSTLEEVGVQVIVDASEEPLDFAPELMITLFRIAQEAVNNIARHADAKHATVTLRRKKDEIYLAIEDDGRGFQVAGDTDEAIRNRHWGLIGIQERLDRVGGTMSLSSAPGSGTLLEVTVPAPKSSKEIIGEQKNTHLAG
jgi:two-component system, NarL family, sensor histidine kinase UhpB